MKYDSKHMQNENYYPLGMMFENYKKKKNKKILFQFIIEWIEFLKKRNNHDTVAS